MAALPSFVQLMASLRLNDSRPDPQRSRSTPPQRRPAARRYSPYLLCIPSPDDHHHTNTSDDDDHDPPSSSSIPRPLRTRRYRHKVSRSDSSSDLAVDTPISTYVRRKTPGNSPISPSFDSGYESSASLNHSPFSVPTLPLLLPNSPASDLDSPSSDCEGQMAKDQDYYRFILQRTGTRISAARAARREQIARRYALRN